MNRFIVGSQHRVTKYMSTRDLPYLQVPSKPISQDIPTIFTYIRTLTLQDLSCLATPIVFSVPLNDCLSSSSNPKPHRKYQALVRTAQHTRTSLHYHHGLFKYVSTNPCFAWLCAYFKSFNLDTNPNASHPNTLYPQSLYWRTL